MRKTKERTRRAHHRQPSTAAKAASSWASDELHAPRGSRYDGFAASITFLVGAIICTFLFFANPVMRPYETYNLVNCGVLLWIPLMVIVLFFRHDPSHFGLTAGDRKFGLKFALLAIVVMLPLVLAAAQMSSFRTLYRQRLMLPLSETGAPLAYDYMHPIFSTLHTVIGYPLILAHPNGLVFYELIMGFYMFCWEFFFRGFLLFGLSRARILGNVGAVIAQTIPFTLLHWSLDPNSAKPMPEIIGAFFGGLALGALAIRTRSFFYGFLIHWAISAALDAFVIAPQLLKL